MGRGAEEGKRLVSMCGVGRRGCACMELFNGGAYVECVRVEAWSKQFGLHDAAGVVDRQQHGLASGYIDGCCSSWLAQLANRVARHGSASGSPAVGCTASCHKCSPRRSEHPSLPWGGPWAEGCRLLTSAVTMTAATVRRWTTWQSLVQEVPGRKPASLQGSQTLCMLLHALTFSSTRGLTSSLSLRGVICSGKQT